MSVKPLGVEIGKTRWVTGVMIFILALFWVADNDAKAAFAKADKVVVLKSKRLMMLLKDGEIFRTYKVGLGKQPTGHKVMMGDKRTPEGKYVLDSRNANSKYHLSIHISYPNETDVENARKLGVPPGGSIMIHGLSESFKRWKTPVLTDWTNGCIAVRNDEIEEIWKLVQDGTPIEIRP